VSELSDILWALQRQARSLQEVLADARLVWRDANARQAEQRFLQPHADAERIVLTSVSAQHQALDAATADEQRADEFRRTAADESSRVSQGVERARQNADLASQEANSATTDARQADALAAEARILISRAGAAGGG